MERQNYDRVENPDPLKLLPHSGEIPRRPIQRKSLQQHVSKQGQVRLLTLGRDVTRQFSPGVQPEFLSKTCQSSSIGVFFFFSFFVGCHTRRHIITPPLPSLKDDPSLSLSLPSQLLSLTSSQHIADAAG